MVNDLQDGPLAVVNMFFLVPLKWPSKWIIPPLSDFLWIPLRPRVVMS